MPATRRDSRSGAGSAACAAPKPVSLRGTSSALFVALLAVACGTWLWPNTAQAGAAIERNAAQGRATTNVTIIDFAFQPASVTINVGDSITWTNSGLMQHTVTSDTGAWPSTTLDPGQTLSLTFNVSGTFSYHCSIHPIMTGAVTVNGANGAPSITSPLSANGTVGVPFSYTIAASGTAPIAFSASNLPAWLSLNTPALSGTPPAAGTFLVSLQATNALGTDIQTLTITISVNNGGNTGGNTVAMPTFNPPAGTYASAQTVTISCATPGATIFFTVDGTVPTTFSTVYSTPINMAVNTTLEALATAPGMADSPVAVGTYNISGGGGGFSGSGATTFQYGGTLNVGGGGPDIIPLFTQDQGGGTPPVTVTFDPTQTYLPVSNDPNQVYTYTAIWNFGDGTGVVLGGADGSTPDQVLALVSHTYTGVDLYTVTFRIDITVTNQSLPPSDPSYISKGPSAFVLGQVHTTNVNFQPIPQLDVLSSPATGVLPYVLQITPSASFDGDGFIVWAAIDWGDGSFGLVTPLPPNLPNVVSSHTYVTPGIYRVTLSVIDNGRMTPLTQLPPKPDPRDPNAALQAYIQANTANAVNDLSLLDPKYNPQLKQAAVLVQVPGNMVITKGQFQVNFRRVATDSFDLQLRPNLFPDSIANASVQITLGSGLTPLSLPSFHLDNHGTYVNQALGLLFAFDGRKQVMRIRLTRAKLAAAFGLLNSTAVNGNVDVPVRILFNNSLSLGTTARFVYSATAGGKGVGKKGHSFPDGN